ncbi:MAG: YbaB/EbfC family nucleoid-associated protein [Bdellovibrionales bacterium]
MKKGFGGGMQQLMRQANQMQLKMKKLQEQLDEKEWDGTSGGGAVKIKVNGKYQLTSVNIDPEVINKDDQEMLQDMILSAANDALKDAKTESEKEMSKISGGLGMMGM